MTEPEGHEDMHKQQRMPFRECRPRLGSPQIACYSMLENSARNSKYRCNAIVVTTILCVNVLLTSSGHVSNIKGIYQLPGHVYRTVSLFTGLDIWTDLRANCRHFAILHNLLIIHNILELNIFSHLQQV